jgi:hypothetical protein
MRIPDRTACDRIGQRRERVRIDHTGRRRTALTMNRPPPPPPPTVSGTSSPGTLNYPTHSLVVESSLGTVSTV